MQRSSRSSDFIGYNENAGFVPGTENGVKDSSSTVINLTQAEANYLNAIVANGKTPEAITTKIAELTHEQLTKARLLNVDLVDADFANLYDFKVTNVKKVGDNVEATITLDRNGKELGAINGIVVLKATNNPVNDENYEERNWATFTGANFKDSNTATVTFPSHPVQWDAVFFKAVIRERTSND